MDYTIFNTVKYLFLDLRFESSVKSYDTQTATRAARVMGWFESSVKSYDTQTRLLNIPTRLLFESSVKSYDTQTQSRRRQSA